MEGFLKFIALLAFSGLLAYFGDFFGSKIGKKRLSFFGLRPKQTAVFITVFTGMFITLVILTIVLFFSSEARDGLFNIRTIQSEIEKVQTELVKFRDRYLESSNRVAQADKRLKEFKEKIQEGEKAIEANKMRIIDLQNSNQGLTREKSSLLSSIKQIREEQQELENVLLKLKGEEKRLNGEILNLNSQLESKAQRKIIFNKNEHLAFAVLEKGTSPEQLKIRLIALIHTSIERAKSRGALVLDLENFWRRNAPEIDKAAILLTKNNGEEQVVVSAAGHNIVQGEDLEGIHFKFRPNNIVFLKGDELARLKLNPSSDRMAIAAALKDFLSEEVNAIAVKKGMLFDPMTQKIGQMDIEGLMNLADLSRQISSYKGPVEIVLVAKENIPVSGPLSFQVILKESPL